MAHPLTREQLLQNRAFVKALRQTGNIRLAARTVGLSPATLHGRRKAHPVFASQWDAALTFANARLLNKGGRTGPSGSGTAPETALRTSGGEPVVVRRRDGKLQLCAAQPGKLTTQCEQAFLAALSATANVRLSAAAAGASVAAFYRRRRQNPAFAREMRLALETGYERLETALLASSLPSSYEDDAWRHNDPPAIPPMTANQALQLLYLHQKEARLGGTPPDLRRRPGESADAQSMRLGLMHEHRMQRAREDFLVAEAARIVGDPGYVSYVLERPVVLPDLAQVPHGGGAANPETAPARPAPAEPGSDDTGFARGGRVHDATRALFGGWRWGDIDTERRSATLRTK